MKQQATMEQLKIDGIAQLKTKHQLIKEGILTKDTIEESEGFFTNIKCDDPSFVQGMANDLGKSLRVVDVCPSWIILESTHKESTFAWPLEAIDH